MIKSFTTKVRDEIKKHRYKDIALKELSKKFLSRGFINNLVSENRLEFYFNNYDTANDTIFELKKIGIDGKLNIWNEQKYRVYVLDGKSILLFLQKLNLDKAYKQYVSNIKEKQKIKKLHSKVNFETANIKRTADSARVQIDDIKKLLSKRKISSLDKNLQEVINVRLKNPYASMNELAVLLGNITKSAINHRFKKIKELVRG